MKSTILVGLGVALTLAPCAATAIHAGAAKGAVVKIGGTFEVEERKGVAYYEGKNADPVRHKLDLYLPKRHKDYPVLFFVHGGAWQSGTKELYAPLGRVFARNGIGTAIINYRLSPQVQHPGHIEDVARAFAWTHKNISKHGGRADRIFVCGHSAGGHLVALLGLDESYLKPYQLTPKAIRGVVPMSGVYDIQPILIFEKAFGKDPKVCEAASPLTHVRGEHPPALILYADKDYPTLDLMAEKFCKKLQDCKCDAVSLKMAERTHISIIVGLADEADPSTQSILEFIARHSDLKLRPRQTKDDGKR